jgi:ABC-type uncharacterized transport system auxiliary subunit
MKYISLFFVFVFLLPFSACLDLKQPSMKITYYTLDYAYNPIPGLNRLPQVIEVSRFSVAPLYHSDRMIYQDQSYTCDSYVYHRWRVYPGDMVTHLLTRDFQLSGLFTAVLSHDNHWSGTHVLEGSVEEFIEIDEEKGWEALLSLSIMLIREKEQGPQAVLQNTSPIVFQKRYHSRSPCERKHPRALAEAMSRNMSRISQGIIKDVYQYLTVQNVERGRE